MKISRRDTLALVAGAVVATTPALALRANIGDARLLDLERRHTALVDLLNDQSIDIPDDECDRICDRGAALSDAIIATPAEGRSGLFVKWRHLRYWQNIGDGDYTDAAVVDFEASMIRLIGGAS